MVQDISTIFKCRTKSIDDVSGCPFKPADCTSPCWESTTFMELDINRIQVVIELNPIDHSNTKGRSLCCVHTGG